MALRDIFRRAGSARSAPPTPRRPTESGGRSVVELRNMLRTRPDNTAARLSLADELAGRGDVEDALTEYIAVVDLYVKNDLHGKAARLLGRVARLAPQRTDLAELEARLSRIEVTLPRRDLQIARLARRPAESLGPADLDAAQLRRFWNAFGVSAWVDDLDDESLGLLLAACEVQHVSPRSVLVRAGQWLPRCYVVVQGHIDATLGGPGAERLALLRAEPGDVIGDRALLDDARWKADHRTAAGNTTILLRLTRRRLEERVAADAALSTLYAALRRHGRDREIEGLLARHEP